MTKVDQEGGGGGKKKWYRCRIGGARIPRTVSRKETRVREARKKVNRESAVKHNLGVCRGRGPEISRFDARTRTCVRMPYVRTCMHTHAHTRDPAGSMNGVNCILRWNRPTNLFSLSFTTGHRRVASKIPTMPVHIRRPCAPFASNFPPLFHLVILLIIPRENTRYFQRDIFIFRKRKFEHNSSKSWWKKRISSKFLNILNILPENFFFFLQLNSVYLVI